MSVTKRGKKGMYYCDFIINGKRKTIRTGCYTKKEAIQFEAIQKQKMLEEQKLSPQERAAKTLLSDAISQVYQARWKSNKNGEFSHSRALRIMEIIGDIPVGKTDHDVIEQLTLKLDEMGLLPSTVNRYLTILKTILRYKMQNPGYTGHPIRFELDTESGSNWTPNPFLTGQ